MTDELRAKFEAWANSVKGSPIPLDVSEYHFVTYLDDVTSIAWHAWKAAYASRDAEVEAIKSFFSQFRSIPEDEWLSLSGLVRRTGSSVEFSRLSVTAMEKESGE